MIKIGFHELAPISSNLLYDGQEYFGELFPLILTPICQVYSHIIGLIGLSLCFRLNSLCRFNKSNVPYNPKFKFTDNRPTFPTASHIEQVSKLSKDINLYGKRRIAMMKILSNRYIGAWRYLKVHLYGENLLHGNEIYEYDLNATRKAILELTTEELNILHEIMLDALNSETLRHIECEIKF